MKQLARGLKAKLERTFQAMPVVVVEGPRAVGKTTLTRSIVSADRHFDLSSEDTFRLADASLRAWLEALPVGSLIDEAQRLRFLQTEVKNIVDRRIGEKGQFLLTGSVRLRRDELGGSDPLVGRALRHTLFPFAQCEIRDDPQDVVTALFDGEQRGWSAEQTTQPQMFELMGRGGFPFSQDVDGQTRRSALKNYARDLFTNPSTATSRDLQSLLGFFEWLSAGSGQLRDHTKFAQANKLSRETVTAYQAELAGSFLTTSVKGWHGQAGKRETQNARVFVVDPALCAVSLGVGPNVLVAEPQHGRLFETFVFTELQRLASWSTTEVDIFHWRESDTREVDLILADRNSNRLVAIEVKSSREVGGEASRGIRAFKERYPERFHRGYVLHCGDNAQRLDDDIWSLPFSALWTIGEPTTSRRADDPLQDALARLRITVSDRLRLPFDEAARRDKILRDTQLNFDSFLRFLTDTVEHLEALGYWRKSFGPEQPPPDTAGETELLARHGFVYLIGQTGEPRDLELRAHASADSNGDVVWGVEGRLTDEPTPFYSAALTYPFNESSLVLLLRPLTIGLIEALPDALSRLDSGAST